jgi:hypothetical protein
MRLRILARQIQRGDTIDGATVVNALGVGVTSGLVRVDVVRITGRREVMWYYAGHLVTVARSNS